MKESNINRIRRIYGENPDITYLCISLEDAIKTLQFYAGMEDSTNSIIKRLSAMDQGKKAAACLKRLKS